MAKGVAGDAAGVESQRNQKPQKPQESEENKKDPQTNCPPQGTLQNQTYTRCTQMTYCELPCLLVRGRHTNPQRQVAKSLPSSTLQVSNLALLKAKPPQPPQPPPQPPPGSIRVLAKPQAQLPQAAQHLRMLLGAHQRLGGQRRRAPPQVLRLFEAEAGLPV